MSEKVGVFLAVVFMGVFGLVGVSIVAVLILIMASPILAVLAAVVWFLFGGGS